MSQTILSAIVSALIAGIFSLIGKWLDARLKNMSLSTTNASVMQTGQSSTTVAPTVGSTSQSISPFSFGRVLIHIGVLQLAVNIVGFIIGFTLGVIGQPDALLPLILLFGTLAFIVGFAWVSARVNKAIRWKHLLYVAIGVTIVTVITNSLILQTPITLLVLIGASVQTFLAMGIGGAIGTKLK